MKFDPKDLKQQELSHLLTDIVVPRPIAWVSTVSDRGVYNLAPFSAYAMVGTNPMVVCFTVSTTREGQKKDTILNLELTKEFVISVVTEDLAEAMNKTSAPYPREVSEYEKAGLTPIKADLVKAPMVGESPVNMECAVLQILEFGETPTLSNLVIGEVLLVHIADELYDKQSGRISGLKAVGRLGGNGDIYCLTRDTFRMKRPTL
jgi:flavin reductase (DIM6/NTAB) family NADH-FMN oxidoreductase RutF